jgi:hypothetical protein
MTIRYIAFNETLEMIKRGEITDGKTIIGLLMVAQNFSHYL